MLFDGQQQILEMPVTRGRIASVPWRRRAEHGDLVDGHREVIGPELCEALEERPVGVTECENARGSRLHRAMGAGS
jgi:hypothetical protein